MRECFDIWTADFAPRIVAAALGLFLQSSIIIAIGIGAAWLVRRRGAVMQSLILRATLLGTYLCIICPLPLNHAGLSLMRITLPVIDSAAATTNASSSPALISPGPPKAFAKTPTARQDDVASSCPSCSENISPGGRGAKAATIPPPVHPSHGDWLAQTTYGVVAAVWLTVGLTLLARLCLAIQLLRAIRHAAKPAPPQWIEPARQCARLIGVAVPPILITHRLKTACLAGLRRPAIFIPAGPRAPERDVLLHELAHLQRKDCFWSLLAHLATAAIWYQPLMWILSRRIASVADEACDDLVIAYGKDHAHYAHTLLDMAERRGISWAAGACAVGIVGFRSTTARRVVRIMDNSRIISIDRNRRWTFGFLALCAAALTLTVRLGANVRVAAAEAATTAPARPPASIFDFGLEPLPNAEQEKPNGAAPTKPESPSPAPDQPKPADAPAKPQSEVHPPADEPKKIVPPPQTFSGGELSPAEKKAVVEATHVDLQGVLTTDKLVTLGLSGTEGKHFIVTGDFYPAAEPTPFKGGGVTFYLRQLSGTKRMELSINGMRIKRILYAGEVLKKFAWPMKFDGIGRERWHHFMIDAGPDAVVVHFDDKQGTAKGPLEMGGSNSIVFGPGAKLRNLKTEILSK